MSNSLKFIAIKLSQPIGELFVARIESSRLAILAEADIRRITSRELEKMSGIQRGLSKTRVAAISKYIDTVDASFPNSFILNLNSEYLESPPVEMGSICGDTCALFCFEIALDEGAFSIIDGQHRLSGFENAKTKDFDLLVSFFIDLPIEDQAYLFSTINVTQQKVNKSLVYDLFDVSETRSPQRTAHLVTKALNSDEDSPFFRRIKLLGVAPKFEDEILYKAPLSQGTVATKIVDAISTDPMRDRDIYKRGGKIELEGNEEQQGLIFRRFFLEEKDWAILRVMKNFFGAVAKTFPQLWAEPNNPLPKTIGYGALMRLLSDAYRRGASQSDLSYDFFIKIMENIRTNSERAEDKSFDFETFPASGSGELKLYRHLKEWSELIDVSD